MTDLDKALLTSGLTIFGGVFIFCISQFIQKFLLEPVQELNKTIGEISFRLDYYANIFPSSNQNLNEDQQKQLLIVFNSLRESSCRLQANAWAIWWYDFFECIRFIPLRSNIVKSKGKLIYISNTTSETERAERMERRKQIEEVKQLLGIKD